MKNNSKIIMVLASAALLASCGGGTANPADIMAGFADKVEGTVSFTYAAKYNVTVDNPALSSFEHSVDDVTTGEYSLNDGDLYLHVVRNGSDKGVSSKSEALVYKADSSYYYLTSTMENPTQLASEAAARAKIDELLVKVSHNNAGDVSVSTALYDGADSYFHREFGLSTGNIAADEFVNTPEISVKGEGVEIKADSDYIGYQTDGGISDFPGAGEAKGGVYTIDTNAQGYVTSYSETINASLAMAIMNPAPVVTIQGTRTYTATYGETIEKKATIDHQLTKGTVSVPNPDTAIVEVYTTPTIGGEKKAVKDGDEVVVGQYLAVKVTPAGNNTIVRVTCGTTSLETASEDGYFYFEIQEGTNKIGVNIQGTDKNPAAKVGTYTLPEDLQGCTLFVGTCAGQDDVQNIVQADQNNLTVGHWLCVKFTAVPEGKTVSMVNVNGGAPLMGKAVFGNWCFVIVEGVNAITFTLAD